MGAAKDEAAVEMAVDDKNKELASVMAEMDALKKASSQAQHTLEALKLTQTKLTAQETRNHDLESEVAHLQERLAQLSDTSTSLGQAEAQLTDTRAQVENLTARLEDLSNQLEQARAEVVAKDDQLHQHSMLLDQLKEENSTVVAKYSREVEEVRVVLRDKSNESRDLQAQVLALKGDVQQATSKAERVEMQLRERVAQLENGQKGLEEERDALVESKTELETRLKQAEVTAKKASEDLQRLTTERQQQSTQKVNSSSSGPSREEIEKWQAEWKEKYHLMEQENIRLRDRTLRAERLLADHQSVGMKRSNSNMMAGVNTLPWLDTKEDDPDDFDLEAPPRSLLHRGSSSLGAGSLVRARYFAQRYVREAMRFVDRNAVRLGMELKENGGYRLLGVGYVLVVHALLIYLVIM